MDEFSEGGTGEERKEGLGRKEKKGKEEELRSIN